jgi:hypothetical protein
MIRWTAAAVWLLTKIGLTGDIWRLNFLALQADGKPELHVGPNP